MRKKGTNAARGGAASKPSPVPSTSYLKTLIHSHSVFFDSLVDLIPSKFYLPGPDEDEKPWFQGLSKVAKASAKKQSRENLKKARRARFDPQNPSSTLDLLEISSKADQNPSDTDEEIETPRPAAAPSDDRSVTYEELRERLQRRIQELRSNRNTRPTIDREPKSKRKREDESEEDKKENKEENKKEKTADITFGKVKVGDEEGKRRKKKKLSKAQELEKAKKLEELKKDPEKGEIVSTKHSWKAAASRAAGVKIHDDPKLLKESIKKEKKRQKKHAEKWKERTEGRDNARKEKQRTRTENIKERIQQKKTRRIEKREKKLMRPGFEGRKEGYVNE